MRRNRTYVGAVVALLAAAAGAVPAHAAAGGFSARITNPWFPVRPGMRWEYRGSKDGRPLRDVVRVLPGVERVEGVPCAIIDDRVYASGRLEERTTDWYTQDAHGTVWYYGERTAEYNSAGHITSRSGTWRAGSNGARAGVFMPAHPLVGQAYEQEHAKGQAEDRFRIVRRHASVTVPFGPFQGTALMTREWTPLEPGVRDGKWYVKGIGLVREASLSGEHEHAELIAFHNA